MDGPAPGVGHAADLRHLRGRQVPRVGLDVVDRGAEAGAAREVGAQLGHADGPAQPGGVRGALRGGGRGEVLPELLHHAAPHHVVHAPVQVLGEERVVYVDPEEAARGAERGPVVADPRRGERVGGGVEAVGEEGVDEGVGPAGDDGDAAPGGDRGGRGASDGAERRGRERAGVGADGAEEVVRDAAAVRGGHLVGGDVEAGVELDLIGVHHLPSDRLRGVDGQLGLPGARGADDHHYPRPRPPGGRRRRRRRRGAGRGGRGSPAAARALLVLLLHLHLRVREGPVQWPPPSRDGDGGSGGGGHGRSAHERSDPIGEEGGHVASARSESAAL